MTNLIISVEYFCFLEISGKIFLKIYLKIHQIFKYYNICFKKMRKKLMENKQLYDNFLQIIPK